MAEIIAYHSTNFGELWEQSLSSLIRESITGALQSAGIEMGQVDAVFFANMLSGVLGNNLHIGAKIAEMFEIHIPAFRVESACASGGMALHLAAKYLEANAGKTVLVVGAEKMTDYSPEQVTEGLSAAASGAEQDAGLTFPGLYAMLARYYMEQYGYTEEHLAYAPVKNHFHGSMNEKAQFRKKITVEQVLKSSYIAHPLKVLDCSPISDGAAAVVLTSDRAVGGDAGVSLLSSEAATDSISLAKRESLDELRATRLAADKAFASAGIVRSDIRVAELHDCFSIAELLAMEDLGFWKKGEAGARMKELPTQYGSGGPLIVNTSGGLKAAGHPVGATGVKQVGELFLQLTGQAGPRQVKDAKYALAHNVGGSGGTAVVTILGV